MTNLECDFPNQESLSMTPAEGSFLSLWLEETGQE